MILTKMNFKFSIILLFVLFFNLISCSTEAEEAEYTQEEVLQELVLSQAEKNMLI